MFKRFFSNRYGYSRWDGSQRIEGLDADDILNALSDDYLEGGNTLDEFLVQYPGVSREQAIAALEEAKALILARFGKSEF